MKSFGRRDYSETIICINESFIFQTPMIETIGRETFIKLQKKIDSNFVLNVTQVSFLREPAIYKLNFTYQIHLHNCRKIEIEAISEITIVDGLIDKMTIKFEDALKAQAIFEQMVFH